MHKIEVLSVILLVFGIGMFFLGFHNIDLSVWSKTTGVSDRNFFIEQTWEQLYMVGTALEIFGVLFIILAYIINLIYFTTAKQ